MNNITRKLVNYISEATFEKIPKEAILKLKYFVLDEIGNALGGSVLSSGKIIIDWGKLYAGTSEATIFADGTKVPISIASGVNTQLCMGLELMETYRNRCHPGSGMVMTALALAERNEIHGKDLLTAICTAYDITGRIIDATWPSQEHKKKVWNQPYQGCGPLVVAMKLLGLSVDQGVHAFGMGLGNGPTMNVHNILYVPGSMSKCANQFHNFVGINAAILAQKGYTGYHEILDEPFPYWRTISDMDRKEIYDKDLGKDFYILSGMAFKPWPTCRWAQPGIQALLSIMDTNNLNVDDIAHIKFFAHDKITNYPYDNTDPLCPEDAYWSVPWAFAAAATGINIGPSWYGEDLFNNDKFKQVMQKVSIATLPEAVEAFEKQPEKSITLLEVKTNTNKTYKKKTEYCKGDPQKPMNKDEIIHKFLSQALKVISREKAYRIIDFVEQLEDLDDVSKIVGLVH